MDRTVEFYTIQFKITKCLPVHCNFNIIVCKTNKFGFDKYLYH